MNSAKATNVVVRRRPARRSAARPRSRATIGMATLGVRDRRRPGPTRPAKLREVELEPDQEHVEDQPEVGDDPDERDDVAGEERAPGGSGESAPKHRRAEQDPGEHLAHHPRLADPHGQRRPTRRATSITTTTAMKKAASGLAELALLGATTIARRLLGRLRHLQVRSGPPPHPQQQPPCRRRRPRSRLALRPGKTSSPRSLVIDVQPRVSASPQGVNSLPGTPRSGHELVLAGDRVRYASGPSSRFRRILCEHQAHRPVADARRSVSPVRGQRSLPLQRTPPRR